MRSFDRSRLSQVVCGNLRGIALAGLIAVLLAPIGAFAQTTATISGTVTDDTGAVVPNAKITVTNAGTGLTRNLATDVRGQYAALSLPVGQYEIRAESTGFAPVVRSGITLVVGQEAVVDIQLKVGGVQQAITVNAESPLVNTTPSSTAGLVSEEQIKDLPLNGRSWDSLITLNPSTTNFTSNQSTTSTGKGQGFNFSISGNREDFNLFLMNGIEYTGVSTADVMPGGVSGLLLGVDAVREFNVQENSYGAEYGKRPGGQVTVVTMSGSNQLHGDLFEFLRNSDLDARNFFAQSINPPFKRNQFGGALGGPIKKDKTFLFGNYEGFRQRLNYSDVTFVPNASAQNGTLLGTNGKPIGLAPGIAPYFALWPQPNGPDLGGGVALAYSNPLQSVREDFGNLRLDQNFSSNDMLSGIYTIDDGNSLTPGANPFTQTSSILRAQVLSLQETHIFSPSVLNVARFGFSRASWNLLASPPVTPPGTSFVPGQPVGLISIGSASFNSVGAVSAAGSNGSQQFERVARNLFTYTDDLQITKGKHLIGAGGWFQRVQANDDAANQRYGVATFASLAAFMQGHASSIVAVLNPAEIPWRQFAGAWYVQDAIKLRPNLTVSLGLRHEFNNGWNSPHNEASNYVFGAAGCSLGTALCLQTQPVVGTSPYTVNNAKLLFGPRVGLAWAPFSKTAIHAAFGTYYNQLDYMGSCCDGSPIGNNLNINPTLGTKTSPATFPIQMTANLPGAKAAPAGVQTDLQTPTVEEWTLKIEQGITPNMLFSLAYVGEHGYHLPDTVDVNTVTPTATANGTIGHPFPTAVVRANNSIANTRYTLSNANSSYNALQVSLTQRFSHGLQFRGNYTFSKSLDIHSSSFLANEGIAGATTIMIPQNPRADWGPSNFNPAHQASGNFSYDLPFGRGRFFGSNASNFADKFIGGWSWHGIVTLQTGFPFTPLVGSNQSNNGDSRNPDRVSINPNFTGPRIVGTPNEWFNPAAFLLPPAGTYGNAGRDVLTGPKLTEVDMSLFKTTAISERIKVQFRAECFNVLNHPNFGMPVVSTFSSGAVSPTAGVITYTTTTQREIQFGLKLLF
jgi:hypothetical protein